jgi:regulator of protease activity HflC (stomatin/prohibitin superfamily)
MLEELIIALVLTVVVIVIIAITAFIIPQQEVYIIERLGKFHRVIGAGWHIVIPILEAVRYRHSLKETTLDTPKQECITKDNVNISVDALLYYKVIDPEKASYGVNDYQFALSQLSQTTLRSEVGCMALDEILEKRMEINTKVVAELDRASSPWGIKVIRFEIQHINPPRDVLEAMEKQMRAEREKRASILTSEGDKVAKINAAEAEKITLIKTSEARKIKQINEAEGEAIAIKEVAEATALGIERIASAIIKPGGVEATQLKLASNYIDTLGNLAKESTSLVLPANLTDVGSMLALATDILNRKPSENNRENKVPLVVNKQEDKK